MASRVAFDDSWRERIQGDVREFFESRLGPDIAADAKRYCPKDTGSLADSIESHVDDGSGNLIVSASGNAERDYAIYVETGHRIYHPSTGTSGPDTVPEQPFLRPALYQERDYQAG